MKPCPRPGLLLCQGRGSPFLRFSERPCLATSRLFGGSRSSSFRFGEWIGTRRIASSLVRLDEAGRPSIRRALEDDTTTSQERRSRPVVSDRRKDPLHWFRRLNRHLPSALRQHADTVEESDVGANAAAQDIAFEGNSLASTLAQARRVDNLELLADLGFEKDRWPAVHSLLTRLLDSVDHARMIAPPPQPLADLDWGSSCDLSLDEVSQLPATPVAVMKSRNGSMYSHNQDMDTIANGRSRADAVSRILMGEIWYSLGVIILRAADQPSTDSKLAMSCVFRVFARLHQSGMVSDRVYKYSDPEPGQAIFRPPGMHLLMRHVMTVLSDAAWLAQEAEIAARAAAVGEDSPYFPFKMDIRHLGPEIWIELVLWCCVEHGYPDQGLSLIELMKSRQDDLAWEFKSWVPLLQDIEAVKQTQIDTEVFWRLSASETRSSRKTSQPIFHGLGKRTISSEVVASLVDGAIDQMCMDIGEHRASLTKGVLGTVSRLSSAMNLLNDQSLQTTMSNSNRLTARLVESGCVDLNSDAQVLDCISAAHFNLLPPWEESTVTEEYNTSQLTRARLFDETSAFLGLTECVMRSHCDQRQTGRAFESFARLQEIVDESKMKRVREFVESVHPIDDRQAAELDGPQFHRLQLPASSMPHVSNVTLAQLLELCTTSRAFKFGTWLLFSKDPDGPPISAASYGDQALAPAILRFAAATKNAALQNEVMQSLEQPFSWNTLKAIVNYDVSVGEWQRVRTMFAYLRDFKLKSWGHSNIMFLAATLLRLDGRRKRSTEQKVAYRGQRKDTDVELGKGILLKLLNGEYNSPVQHASARYYQKALSGLHQVFMASPGVVQEVASNASPRSRPQSSKESIPLVPAAAFNEFLRAVVDVYGSQAGYSLCKQCCRHPGIFATRHADLDDDLQGPLSYYSDKLDLRRHHHDFSTIAEGHAHEKVVIPDLDTIRAIAHVAVTEHESSNGENTKETVQLACQPSGQESTDRASSKGPDSIGLGKVMNYCVRMFRELGLDSKEIDRETGGFLSRQRVWRAAKRQRKNAR